MSRSLLILLVVAAPRVPTAADERPNVLFIAIDDLNDWVGCLGGHPQALTPNIDRLAKRGMLFTNAHCAATACNPSRAALFSGRWPNVTGVWSNSSGSVQKLAPKSTRLTATFAKAGYRTLGTGKMLHGNSQTEFEDYFGTEQRWSPLSRKSVEYTKAELPSKGTDNPRHVVKDGRGREVVLPLNRMPSDRNPTKRSGESFDWGPFDVPDSDFGDTRITDWAIDKLKEPSEKPLFLAVGYYRPHIPLWAPQRFFERFEKSPATLPPTSKDDLADLSPTGRKWAREAVTAGSHATVLQHDQWRPAVEAYLACTTYVDHEIGRLLDAFDESAYAKNTVVVLWTDHGWHLGEKEHWGKWTGWERSTRVPLIVVPPRATADEFADAGSRCIQPVSLIDLYPTLVDVCDVPAPKLDGRSLRPLLREPERSTNRLAITTFDRGNVSLRSERYRYIHYADGSEELYDLESDPHEWSNLASDDSHRDRLQSFADAIPVGLRSRR